jgi:hypothetical protein
MDLTPEFRLFCLALRRPQRAEDTAALRRAIAAAPDWTAIVAGARRHRVAPFLYAGLQTCGSSDVPAEVVAELRRQTLAAAARSLAQLAEIGRLFRAFADGGVCVLALKGVVLSAQLHGDSALRNARDIDILVDPRDLGRADAVLAAAGYRHFEATRSPRQAAAYLSRIKDIQYIHGASGARLELHHRLTDNPSLLPCDFGTLWSGREHVRVDDADIATLARSQLALYLCAHGAGHGWERLGWLVDLAAVLHEPESVEAALAAADGARLVPAMLHAMILAHDWLGAPIAERHLTRARANADVSRLDRILAHLYAGAAWHQMPPRGSWSGLARYSVWQRFYRLSLKSGWRYRTNQATREWFTPADWNTLRLPDALFWLYPLMRPVGWLMRRWQR